MSDNSIKVGFCVAYDWPLLAYALPRIYNRANVICLSIDCERISWTKKKFLWNDAAFKELIRSIDAGGKIVIYEDNFHLPDLTPAQNEVRQRRLMSEKMGIGGWHVQLDCDEYFLNFDGFADFLQKLKVRSYHFNVSCQLITLFKKVDNGFLYVCPEKKKRFEFLQVASKTPQYEHGRRNGNFNVLSGFLIVHQSWARDDEEILQKLSNWGHIHDFNVQRYFRFWKNINAGNFRNFTNIHPIQPEAWPSLRFIRSNDVVNIFDEFHMRSFPKPHRVSRILSNSLLVSRIRSGVRNIVKRMFLASIS